MKNFFQFSEYFSFRGQQKKFTLPLSLGKTLQHLFLEALVKKFFSHKQYLVVKNGIFDAYWQIIFDYICLKFNTSFSINRKAIFGIDGFNSSSIYVNENYGAFSKHISGHASTLENGEESYSKAIGEFLERYFTASDRLNESVQVITSTIKSNHRYDTYHTLNNSTLFKSINHIQPQYIYAVQCEDLLNRKKVFLPAQSIFWIDTIKLSQNEGLIIQGTTNGCGGGFTVEMATLSALYELFERDSFMMHWLSKSAGMLIDTDSIHIDIFIKYRNILNSLHISLNVLDITSDLRVPTICLVAKSTNNDGGVWVSASSGMNSEKMIIGALSELISLIADEKQDESKFLEPLETVHFFNKNISRLERLNLWRDPRWSQKIDFLFSGAKVSFAEFSQHTRHFSSEQEELSNLLSILRTRGDGYDNVFRKVIQDKRLEKLGYCVVRVVVPKLYPLFLFEDMFLIESQRLDDFLKFKAIDKQSFNMNKLPHPFP